MKSQPRENLSFRSMSLKGEIFRYGTSPSQIAFKSGQHKRHLILVHGLGEGILCLPYAGSLASALDNIRWSLVQTHLRSSYQAFGVSSLDQDAEDLRNLAVCLKNEHNCDEFAIMGNSTGCQDSIRFVKRHGESTDIPHLRGIILQAPVSDQEDLERNPETAARIQEALKMQSSGKGQEILFRDYDYVGEPMKADRFVALAQRRGDDDMFSSYLSDSELAELHSHMREVKCLVLMSGKDQYVPEHVDKELLAQRLTAAMGSLASYTVIEGADHEASHHKAEVVDAVVTFLS